ncbi:MAG: hypothetical protein M1812_006153 [Candelaria pacifica]|nr:MAG: hypothetical protein M1812_006153 [Candelaria pacifica]
MEDDTYSRDVVDPEVRAYVSSLVSALGGTGADEDGRYVLGDDALACLKDLKKWLKLHDEKANRLDVARCLAEANLVNGDLLEILAAWPEEVTEDRIKSKIALACLELLVPLTWPIEKDDAQMTVNHHRHTPYLQLAQVSYKRGIINHDTSKILRTAVRIGLPSMAQPLNDRSSRDEGIIKLLLYFLRNIAMIAVPQNLPSEGDENEVSRSATVEAFHYQDIFHVLLTISSSMGEDFNTQDVVVLEILFHLLKGVDIEKLFMDDSQLDARQNDDLRMLMKKEAGMKRGYARNAPTRHNRFGTMIWIKRDDERMSTLSGQDALVDGQKSLAKMDKTKRWNKPKLRGKNNEVSQNGFDLPIPLTASANKHVRAFVEDFLDSGFNPLFNHLRKAIEREAERLLEVHSRHFFFLISWFLEAELVRRKAKAASQRGSSNKESDLDSFALVASVLNQETFVALNRFMQASQDQKEWQDLNAGMRCFTQILLIVQDMSDSPLEDDQEIAENIQNRIFYEEATHDRVISILRTYKDQGFGYLDACTELCHVFLRMLERYSKQNVDMQVRSKRRARRKKKAEENPDANNDDDDDEGSETEDVVQAQRASSERKFDFTRFSSKFMTQKCIDTYIQFTRYYNDLDTEQLKRAHRFFYRVAFKLEMTVLLFRVDIIALFNKMMKGPDGLEAAHPAYREWDELVRQLIKRLVRKLDQRPELAVEMLFSKINATVHYLEYGYEKQTVSSNPRAPAELEVKPGMGTDEQIGVAVSVLVDQNKSDALAWVKGVLASASSERQSWEDEAAAVAVRLAESSLDHDTESASLDQSTTEPSASRAPSIMIRPDTDARRVEMFKDNKLRLLMTLVGFERLGSDDTDPDASWVIPSSQAAKDLEQSLKLIKQFEFSPPTYDDGKSAEEFLRRKSAVRPRAEFDDDSEGDNGDETLLFPANTRSARPKSDALEELKTKRRRRHKDPDEEPEEMDDATREARREAKRKADLMKRLKIKSDLLVHSSDEESDEERDREFFAKEEERRRNQSNRVFEALRSGGMESGDDIESSSAKKMDSRKRKTGVDLEKSKPRKKRKETSLSASEDDEEIPSNRSRSSSIIAQSDFPLEDAEDEVTDTPLSSLHMQSSQDKATRSRSSSVSAHPSSASAEKVDSAVAMLDLDDDEDAEEDIPPVAKRRPRLRAGFIIDSDSE